jgi:predicted acylesterase/phospholipase RssA
MSTYDTLVLPSGGVRGFYLLGAVQALIDSYRLTDISTYIGTSVGSILCYLLAIGYTPIEIMIALYNNKWLEKMQEYNLVAMLNGEGAISFTSLYEALEKLTIEKIGELITLGKLKEKFGKTLICVTHNMTTSVTEYLGPENYPDLPCITALRMSSNIPLIFDRFKYLDCFYIDGGLSDNFPIIKGCEIGKKVIGVYLNVSKRNLEDDPDEGVVAYFLKLLQIPVRESMHYKIKQVLGKATVIPVVVDEVISMISFDVKSKKRLEMFSTGYNCVKEYYKDVSEIIDDVENN